MKKVLTRSIMLCACILFLTLSAHSQTESNPAAGALRKAGKVTVVVVGSAAKSAWVTTKFVAKRVAGPATKFVLLKAPEAALKFAGRAAKSLFPAAGKLSLAYLKTKMP